MLYAEQQQQVMRSAACAFASDLSHSNTHMSSCRVIVPDLPAHGARFKEVPLTLDNAVKTLEDVISKEAPGEKVRTFSCSSSSSHFCISSGQK
jgi:hypothetical protein